MDGVTYLGRVALIHSLLSSRTEADLLHRRVLAFSWSSGLDLRLEAAAVLSSASSLREGRDDACLLSSLQ